MDTDTDTIISYGHGSMFKTLRKNDELDSDGTFIYERGGRFRAPSDRRSTFIYERGGSNFKQSVVLTQTDLLEAIELWLKKHS
jgi:hypothetical protein